MFVKYFLEVKMPPFVVDADDINITGDDHEEIEHLIKFLAKVFEVKNLGPLMYFLGMEVTCSNDEISMSLTIKNGNVECTNWHPNGV